MRLSTCIELAHALRRRDQVKRAGALQHYATPELLGVTLIRAQHQAVLETPGSQAAMLLACLVLASIWKVRISGVRSVGQAGGMEFIIGL